LAKAGDRARLDTRPTYASTGTARRQVVRSQRLRGRPSPAASLCAGRRRVAAAGRAIAVLHRM